LQFRPWVTPVVLPPVGFSGLKHAGGKTRIGRSAASATT
jgi:hypothetical protein